MKRCHSRKIFSLFVRRVRDEICLYGINNLTNPLWLGLAWLGGDTRWTRTFS